MAKATLVVLAAGMGSRYGGLKQIDPIDNHGNVIIDFSIYDAIKAGFDKVVFIIKHEIEKDFKEAIGERISKQVEVEYVYQELDKLPEGYSVPEGRVKPFGTAHALLCCKGVIDGPFAVINSDDYYGPDAYKTLYKHLTSENKNDKFGAAIVGYILKNTLTENGYVSRGICAVEDGKLVKIDERTQIEMDGDDARYTTDGGKTYVALPGDSLASMNMWGFNKEFIDELEAMFIEFLNTTAKENPLKGEFFIPVAVDTLIQSGKMAVDVYSSADKWYGVTYAEDKPKVTAGIQSLKDAGVYPDKLWE